MKIKIGLLIFFFLFLSICFPVRAVTTLACTDDLSGKLMLSELTPTATDEWVEIVNGDQNNAINLSGCTIVAYPTSGSPYTLNLSGTIGRGAILTFPFPTATLDDAGGMLTISSTLGTLSAMSYGSYLPQVAAPHHVAAVPNSDKSACINLDANSWSSTCVLTKGWCNPVGFGDCPSMATLSTMMASEGVTTNLTLQSDYSRTSGLYFEMTGMGRISFLSSINFTDRFALQWMRTLDQKLDLSTKGRIVLDATLIRDLADTNAQLTMYGLTLNDPQVMVDGSVDSGGVVSGISYNKVTGTLTFTAAHFTTFTAVEKSSSSSSNSSTSGTSCSDPPPSNSPHLFQIDTSNNSAKLYFTPVNDHLSYYFIAYGYDTNDDRFGISFPHGLSKGVENYTINALVPNTTYYFKIRGGNGCSPGSWSNILPAKTENTHLITETSSKNTREDLDITVTPVEIKQPLQLPTKQSDQSRLQNNSSSNVVIENNSPSILTKIIAFFKGLFNVR